MGGCDGGMYGTSIPSRNTQGPQHTDMERPRQKNAVPTKSPQTLALVEDDCTSSISGWLPIFERRGMVKNGKIQIRSFLLFFLKLRFKSLLWKKFPVSFCNTIHYQSFRRDQHMMEKET